nr:leukocidin family pore-forming toxin [Photobacterium leiognathi]
MVNFSEKDYRVERSTTGSQNVSFKWNRHHYNTAESLLNRSSDALWVWTYPGDKSRINQIAYKALFLKWMLYLKLNPIL